MFIMVITSQESIKIGKYNFYPLETEVQVLLISELLEL